MRLLICAGGTGGGVYPALAVLQQLDPGTDQVLWVGGEGGMEAGMIQREGIPFAAVPAAGLHGVGLGKLPGNLVKLARGYAASRRIIRSFEPDVLLFTGGFLAVPVALAAGRRPKLVIIPDLEPGSALKLVGRLADALAVSVAETKRFFPQDKDVLVSGYPTRSDLAGWDRARGRAFFGIAPDARVLLVFGGSKGARSINQAVAAALPRLLEGAELIHISGTLDHETVKATRDALPTALQSRYHLLPYLHEMGAALSAADLAVSRAGASILGEFPLFGLPAVLVPYPYAWRYQKSNAEYLAGRQAALVIEDRELARSLLPAIQGLLADPARLQAMRSAAAALACPDAAHRIAAKLRTLAKGSA